MAIALPLPSPFRWKRGPKPAVRRDRPATPTIERDRTAKPPVGLGRRVGSFVVALPDHLWLDRVVRGRAWIPLLGVLLAGIVAAQVEILKLGATMGRALEQTTTLTTQNEQLQSTVAQLADDQRIERLAGAMGLVLPPPGAVGYIAARPGGDVGGALGNLHAPDAAAFVTLTPKNGALVTGPGASTLPPPLGAPLPPTSTTTQATSSATTTATTSPASTSSQSTATIPSTTASAGTTTTTSTTASAGTTSSPTDTASSPTPASPPTTSQTTQAPPTTVTTQAAPPTGAAAIQPPAASQPGGGG
jgi:hypothetical protein